jgi:3-oxoacyl-[acyl-carrier-protein] synthase-3
MPNSELQALVDTSDEWIRERTGIGERRIAAPEESTCTLAVLAAREAMERAGVAAADLDLIILATCTPDYGNVPATASVIQDALGARRAGAFDLNAVCSGFLYGLAIGSQFILNGVYQNVLLIGAEVLSRIVDWQDRSTCVVFGDAAGAVVLRPTDEPGGLLSFVLGNEGAGASYLTVPAGGTRLPASAETVRKRLHFVKMDGREVFRLVTTLVPEAVLQALTRAGLTVHDVDLLIPHQANARIIDAATRRLGISENLVFSNVERYGNTSAASIPVALCEALEQGRVSPGDTIVLAGFGAGLTWGAAVWKWHQPNPNCKGQQSSLETTMLNPGLRTSE